MVTFNGIHKSYENYVTFTFKQNEITMDKPIISWICCIRIKQITHV